MQQIRNIAVIAHVDHGKTTLIDALLKQTHTFRDNQKEMSQHLILDNNDLERERGITIVAKNCEIEYKNTRINIIDTPGHADFSGEVERTLGMADGALLIVDAQEGPMPQTRFVLRKALELRLKIIVVINKIDKKNANITRTEKRIEDLFLDLAIDETDLHFTMLYANAKNGVVYPALPTTSDKPGDTTPLLDTILADIPQPKGDSTKRFKMLVSNIDYDPHLGRILIGKIHTGVLAINDQVILTQNPTRTYTITKLFQWHGLQRQDIETASAGNIVAIAGINEAEIGTTLSDPKDTISLDSPQIGEPTLHIQIGPNTSPFAGTEGTFTSSRHIEERLLKELEKNLSLRVEKIDGKFKVSGRGELHLTVLLETMRREGYEMEVGKPEVIIKTIDGVAKEPVEEVSIIVTREFQGVVTTEVGKRYGKLIRVELINDEEIECVFEILSRATLGLRSILLTLTKGTLVYSAQVIGWQPLGKPLPKLRKGALIATETGNALTYGLHAAQERGDTFVEPGTNVYEGMIVGINAKESDVPINICRNKKLTNMRASSADIAVQLSPAVIFSLEQALDFLEKDELLEITPLSLRLRKRYLTDLDRRRQRRAS